MSQISSPTYESYRALRMKTPANKAYYSSIYSAPLKTIIKPSKNCNSWCSRASEVAWRSGLVAPSSNSKKPALSRTHPTPTSSLKAR